MKIKNIFFDLDGTLTDPASGITGSIQFALRKLGKSVPAVDDLLWCIGPPLLASFRKMLGQDAGKAETALSLYREHYNDEGKFNNKICAGIPETLQGLIKRGFTLFIATSKPQIIEELIESKADYIIDLPEEIIEVVQNSWQAKTR